MQKQLPTMRSFFTKLFFFATVLVFSFPQLSIASQESRSEDTLNLQYWETTQKAFKNLSSNEQLTNIELLTGKLKSLAEQNNPLLALGLISSNMPLIEENIDHPQTSDICSLLLHYDEMKSAEYLLIFAKTNASNETLGLLNFEFAQYYFKQGELQKTLQHLTLADIDDALSQEQSDYADIMYGAILQYDKQHRKAIKYYDRIKPESTYYSYALLNKALAFIRQDWWTDGHIEIEKAIKIEQEKEKQPDHESSLLPNFIDRLYLVLGYSQIQNEFYRDARESLRSIELNSSYTNRALFGIGISALHQGDFIGALNAFKILQGKEDSGISGEESYLMIPFVLEKLKQNKTATASYSEAIAHYQNRISELNKLINALGSETQLQNKITAFSTAYVKGNNESEQSTAKRIEHKLNILEQLKAQTPNPALRSDIVTLKAAYNKIHSEELIYLAEQQKTIFNSYLSQARYGLAKLYDSK